MNSQFHKSIHGLFVRSVNSNNIPRPSTWTPEDIDGAAVPPLVPEPYDTTQPRNGNEIGQ